MIRVDALFNRRLLFVSLAMVLVAGFILLAVIPRAQAQGTTWTVDDFVLEDNKFELRMGPNAYWGYNADQDIPTIAGLIEIVMGPIQVGDTVSFSRCRQSGSRSTKPHRMTIEKLGIDHKLSADEGGGSVGDNDDPTNNCEFTFTAPGEYIIDDSSDPGAHGVAKFIVEGAAMEVEEAGPIEPTGLETVVVDPLKVDIDLGKSRSKREVWIYGSGFSPGTELIVLVSANGVLSDISTPLSARRDGGGSVAPLIVTQFGTWATSWRLGRFTRSNVGDESNATIIVVDSFFNDLATTPLLLCNTSGRAAFAEANPDATEVTLQGLGGAISDLLEADASASVGYFGSKSLSAAAVNEVLAANPDATVAHVDDLDDPAGAVLIVVPEWCSTSPLGERSRAGG